MLTACGIGMQALGIEGAVFGLLYAGAELRSYDCAQRSVCPEQWGPHLAQVWMRESMICLCFDRDWRSARLWLFKDEFSETHWAAIRRAAISQCPKEPVGLSISR